MSRQLISTVTAVAALAFTAVIATTITWSAIATPAAPVVMTKADFDRTFADAAAAARPAAAVMTRADFDRTFADAADAARPAAAVMTRADFDRTFADATAAAGPAYATGVQREELRRLGRKLLRAAERPVAAK
jgi:hypothetical protein